MNKKILFSVILLLSVIGGVIFARQSQVKDTPLKLPVVATFYPLAEFARQVGGDLVEIQTLVPTGTEPHDFEPTTQDIAKTHKSAVLLYNGLGFEGWLNKVIPDLEKSGVLLVDSSQGISVLAANQSLSGEESLADPHIWLDPTLAQQQVRTITAAFIKADPIHQIQYQQNADAYIQKLQMLDQSFKTGLSNCQGRQVVTSHAAFGYLAKKYGFQVLPISGLSPDEEPSPQRLAQIAREVKKNQTPYIFFESLVSPALANTIAVETGAKTLVFNPLEGLAQADISAGKEYISVQEQNLQNLRLALKCQ